MGNTYTSLNTYLFRHILPYCFSAPYPNLSLRLKCIIMITHRPAFNRRSYFRPSVTLNIQDYVDLELPYTPLPPGGFCKGIFF